jgi:hypothetical protein
MCPCSCHSEPSPTGVPYAGCGECAHLHSAEELAGATLAPATVDGTKDATLPIHNNVQKPNGCDHDQPYTWGRTPTVKWPFPFTQKQMARLLNLKSKLGDGRRDLKNRHEELA